MFIPIQIVIYKWLVLNIYIIVFFISFELFYLDQRLTMFFFIFGGLKLYVFYFILVQCKVVIFLKPCIFDISK